MERERRFKGKHQDRVILWYSPYGILDRNKTSNGVNDLFQEGRPHIESKGYEIISVAPKVRDNSDNAADYNLGKTLITPRIVSHLVGTNVPFSLPYKKDSAGKIIKTVKPDFLFLEEPTQGFGAHGLISGMPKREDGRPMSVQIGRFHAGIYGERTDAVFRFLLGLSKSIRRPETSKGIPNGKLSPGLLNTLLTTLDVRIAVSNATAQAFEKRFRDNQEYKIVYNGINTEELTPEGPTHEGWKKDEKNIVLCAMGRMEPRKGVEYAVEAFAIIIRERPNTVLIIAGDGSERRKVESKVDSLGIRENVRFVGVLSREDYVKGLRTADVCICPAVGGEGFGRVAIEPLSCGTPVVLSNIDGYYEAVDGGRPFALMAEPKNHLDIAKQTLRILSYPKDAKEKLKSEAALFVRERYAWSIIAEQISQILDEAYQKHGGVDWSKQP